MSAIIISIFGGFGTYFNKSVLDEPKPDFDTKSEVISLNPET
jgi:hypothetical protein